MSNLRRFLLVILVFVAGALAGTWTVHEGRMPFVSKPVLLQVSAATTPPINGDISFTNGFAPVARRVLPAVVNISSSKTIRSNNQGNSPFLSDPFFRQFFGDEFSKQLRTPREQREHSLGSGVIVSPAGYILTNNHVVDGASEIKVTLADNREFTAKLVGTDPRADVAVVKVEATNLPVLTLGDSSKMEVGDFVLAAGNPFGIGRTVTMGIISATGRGNLGIEDYEDFIQTDAAINPGNSGGALVNVSGELIGINTAILTGGGGGGNQGVGFAVPINMARAEMEQILKTGKVVRGFLGVQAQSVNGDMAKAFGINEARGAIVADVTPNSPAAKSGIKAGDVIVGLNGDPIEDNRQLGLRVSQMSPGTNVKVKVLRDGKPQEFAITLAELPSKPESAGATSNGEPSPHLGISVEALTSDIARQLTLPAGTTGVVVSDVESGSVADEAGVRSGDVIQQVNRKPVDRPDAFAASIRQAGNQPVLLLIDRGGEHRYLVLTPR
jgi:serine protease Do